VSCGRPPAPASGERREPPGPRALRAAGWGAVTLLTPYRHPASLACAGWLRGSAALGGREALAIGLVGRR